jgi:hypothetical protein
MSIIQNLKVKNQFCNLINTSFIYINVKIIEKEKTGETFKRFNHPTVAFLLNKYQPILETEFLKPLD